MGKGQNNRGGFLEANFKVPRALYQFYYFSLEYDTRIPSMPITATVSTFIIFQEVHVTLLARVSIIYHERNIGSIQFFLSGVFSFN